MNADLSYALQITLIGMCLVFGAIVLLWGIMAALVRFLTPPTPALPEADEVPKAITEIELKQRAAAAAVSYALSHQRQQEAHLFPLPPTAFVSAWQAVMRSTQLRQRGPR
ncbi:MAG: OadG family protein [Chloroflexi bacterium]|nr:OadG family protein [Chloroflexota bacterium]